VSKKLIFLRFTNTIILGTIITLTLTGLYGLMWPMPGWMFDLHRVTAWMLVAILPWKGVIVWGSLKRDFDKRFIRSVAVIISLLLAAWAIFVFGLALFWVWRAGPERLWWYQTALSWHWYLGLGLLLPFIFHVWQRWSRPRRTDFISRRSALKLIGLSVASVTLWGISEAYSKFRRDTDRPSLSTGSREVGSYTGLGYPINMMVGEGKIRIDAAKWKLAIKGAVRHPFSLNYEQVLTRSATEVTATLDCTDGWYTTQIWRGIPLAELLDESGIPETAIGVILRAASGYPAYLTLGEAKQSLLATHSGGQVFDHWHGFPLRAVVPSRRGWQWVKWLVEVEVL
jgi:hypothetical protein